MTDVEREKEEEEFQRALELSKVECGIAAGQISDDEDSEKSHKVCFIRQISEKF